MRAPRLLVVTRHTPVPGRDGASAYLGDLLSYLARRGTRIELVWIKAEGEFVRRGWWRVPPALTAIADVHVVGSLAIGPYRFFWWGPLKARFLGNLKYVLQRLGFMRHQPIPDDYPLAIGDAGANREPDWSELPSVNETRFVRERLKRFRADAVLVNYCWLTPLFPRGPVKKLVLTNDVVSHRLAQQGAGTCSDAFSPASFEGEARLLKAADAILAISDDDAAVFASMHPTKAIVRVPKAAIPRDLGGNAVSGRCLFVGAVNPPNREGLGWLLNSVWPLVRTARKDATLHVCGAICNEFSNTLLPDGVILRGRVDDLDLEYRQAEVVAIPLLQGTGVKIKLVEAVGLGRACVSTPVGLQGLRFLRDAVVEASDAESFAGAILELLNNPPRRAQLQERALASVAANLSPEQCYGPVWQLLQDPTAKNGDWAVLHPESSPDKRPAPVQT